MSASTLTLTDASALLIGHEEAQQIHRKRVLSGEVEARSLPFKLRPSVSALSRPVLSSALFGFRKDPVRIPYTQDAPLVLKAYPCPQYGDCVLTYIGEELRQDDRRVLTFLIEQVRDSEIDHAIKFGARDFCEAIGWGRDSRSVEKLDACLTRLYSAALRVKHSRGFFMCRFLTSLIAEGELRFVRLHLDLRDFFDAGHTFLPCREYRQLTDGLATWLHGFLRAHSDECCFRLADLHKASGSTAELKTFGTMVRETLPKLLDAGVVGAYQFARGTLKVAY